jgi:ABC-type uncharacterized transport system auxiliary subunit
MRIFSNAKMNHQLLAHRVRRFRAISISFLGLTSLAILLAACGAPRPVKYYQLSYPMSAPSQQPSINVSILVRTFDSPVLYKDNRIVYATSPQELGLYEGQRWVTSPVEMLQDSLIRGLRASGHYRSVMSVRGEGGGEYALTGNLYEFCEFDGAEIVARLKYVARLRDRKTGLIVWIHNYDHDEPAGAKTVPAVAAAMDKNVQRSVAEVEAGLADYFNANPPKTMP